MNVAARLRSSSSTGNQEGGSDRIPQYDKLLLSSFLVTSIVSPIANSVGHLVKEICEDVMQNVRLNMHTTELC